MIVFKKIRWSNFLSTGQNPTEIDLSTTTTTLITGENGAGKSTLLDALTFALYGKPYRTVNKPQLINSVNEKDCMVELSMSIGTDEYFVRRGLEPAVFEITKNGEVLNQDAKSKDYQKMFEEQILRQTHKAFCQVAILGSANYTAFMELSAADRRSVVESILDINIFSQMNTLLKGKQSQTKEELGIVEADIGVLKEKIKINEKYLSSKEKDNDRRVEEYIKDIERCEKDEGILLSNIGEQHEELKKLFAAIEDKDNISKNISSLSTINRQLKNKIKSLVGEVEFYAKNDTCPTCTQKIDVSFKEKVTKAKSEKITDVQTAIVEVEEQALKTEERTKEIDSVLSKIRAVEVAISDMNSSVRSTISTKKKLQTQVENCKKSKSNEDLADEEELAKLKLQLEEIEADRKSLVENQYYYGIAYTLLKDSGIKSKIIKQYVPVINQIINKYLNQMGLFVSFHLDEEFNETIKSRYRDNFTYASFSEGEKRKIDLSLLFAWRAIAGMKNSINTNLLIMDEVLDGSLDDSSVESFLEILKNLNPNINIFVISHKPKELLESKFQRHIQFAKKGNFSTKL